MTAPETSRRPRRRTLVLGGAALALVVVVAVLLTALGGSSGNGGPDGAAGGASGSSAPTTSGTSAAGPTSTAPLTSAPPPTPTPTGSTDDVDALPSQVAPVGLGDQAATGDGVTARLTSASVVQAEGRGPGSVSGRALQVTVELSNGTAAAVSFSGVDVNADTGADHQPAPPVVDGQSAGISGTAGPGDSLSGTYLFSLPDDASTVTVLVGYQAGAPLLVFTGQV